MVKTLQVYLGTALKHTVYEAEGVGLVVGLHLLKGLSRQLTHPTVLGTDSRVVIQALGNQKSHVGQYILNSIHKSAEQLHAKQDHLQNQAEHSQEIKAGNSWKGRTWGVVDLQIHWVPGHHNFQLNKQADEEAKKAAQGESSDAKLLPPLLHKHLPLSISALQQDNNVKLIKRWEHRWKLSARENLLKSINNTAPSKKYLRLIKDLDC